MFRKILLILFLCGLTGFSVVLDYRSAAEMSECRPQSVCEPETLPPCEKVDCLPSQIISR